LGGSKFPPQILYKVFTKGTNVHYFSGDLIIQPGSKVYISYIQAAEDSYSLMGHRLYHQRVYMDDLKHDFFKIAKPFEIKDRVGLCKLTNEYIQYINSLDLKPIHIGGRNNSWREITGTGNLM
jgi:hypothetical protein